MERLRQSEILVEVDPWRFDPPTVPVGASAGYKF
jgi:hypothetical protein